VYDVLTKKLVSVEMKTGHQEKAALIIPMESAITLAAIFISPAIIVLLIRSVDDVKMVIFASLGLKTAQTNANQIFIFIKMEAIAYALQLIILAQILIYM